MRGSEGPGCGWGGARPSGAAGERPLGEQKSDVAQPRMRDAIPARRAERCCLSLTACAPLFPRTGGVDGGSRHARSRRCADRSAPTTTNASARTSTACSAAAAARSRAARSSDAIRRRLPRRRATRSSSFAMMMMVLPKPAHSVPVASALPDAKKAHPVKPGCCTAAQPGFISSTRNRRPTTPQQKQDVARRPPSPPPTSPGLELESLL